MAGWTCGSHMESAASLLCSCKRTCAVESLWHLCDIYVPKWMGCNEFYYKLGVMCAVESFNFQKDWKNLTDGVVRKTKYHQKGILSRQQRKHIIEQWRTDLMRSILGKDKHTERICDLHDLRLRKATERRQRWKEKHEAEPSEMVTALRATAVGVAKKELRGSKYEAPSKPRPRPPLPFKNDTPICRSDTERLREIQRVLVFNLPEAEKQAAHEHVELESGSSTEEEGEEVAAE